MSLVTGNYFSLLGVNAVAGRTFTADDDRVSGGHPVIVISYGYWERKFRRASDIVGRTLTFNDTTYTVIGVTPRNFTGEWVGRPADFWIPLAMLYQVMPELPPGKRGGGDGLRTGMNFRIIARLKPGVTISQAQATGQVVFQQLMTEAAGPNLSPQQRRQIASMRLEVESAATGYSLQRESFAQPLAILMIMVGLVLLIACAIVANLLMARAASRRREMAVRLACLGLYGVISYSVARRTNEIGVRLALGATPADVLRLVLTESLSLVLAGVAIGIPVTLAATTLISTRLFGISAADPSTIAVATLLMISVAAMAASLPARRASQVDPMVALRCE